MAQENVEFVNYARLSVRARLAAAALGMASWLDRVGLSGRELDELLDHLWQWQSVTSETFISWHESAPDLVETALGGEMPDDLEHQCLEKDVSVVDFRRMVESTTEIVYFNLFSAVDDQATLTYLREVEAILHRYGLSLPVADPFSNSLFGDAHGWGEVLTPGKAMAWRRRNVP